MKPYAFQQIGRFCALFMCVSGLYCGFHGVTLKFGSTGRSTNNCILTQFAVAAYDSLLNPGEHPVNIVIRPNSQRKLEGIGHKYSSAASHGTGMRPTGHAEGRAQRFLSGQPYLDRTPHIDVSPRSQPAMARPYEAQGDFIITAYALSEHSTGKTPGTPGFGITFSGAPAKLNRTIAVDPRVIPIGTSVYIEGIGWRIAEDTGGKIKGKHIDVLLPSDRAAYRFGVKRHVRVFTYRTALHGKT